MYKSIDKVLLFYRGILLQNAVSFYASYLSHIYGS